MGRGFGVGNPPYSRRRCGWDPVIVRRGESGGEYFDRVLRVLGQYAGRRRGQDEYRDESRQKPHHSFSLRRIQRSCGKEGKPVQDELREEKKKAERTFGVTPPM